MSTLNAIFLRAYEATKNGTILKTMSGIGFVALGGMLGYLKAKRQAQIDNENYSQANLKSYKSQEQVNFDIDQSGKPAVIYYYLPHEIHHYNIRHGFIRCSQLAKDKADFYMVNLTKKLEKAIPELHHQFPLSKFMLEVRFPKQKCEVQFTDGDKEEKVTYRREFFNHQFERGGGVQAFLQENGLIEPKDPLKDFATLTKNCLFEPIRM